MGVSTMGPPGCLIMCFNMITALSSAVWTPAQPKNNVWEGPAGICRTHKQGLQGLEEQPKRTPSRPRPGWAALGACLSQGCGYKVC